jgi:hypothetical protein
MSTLTVDIPDDVAEKLNCLFAYVDRDALVTTLLSDFLDRVNRLPSAKAAISDNPDLPISFVLDLLEARAEGRQSAVPFSPGTTRQFIEQA